MENYKNILAGLLPNIKSSTINAVLFKLPERSSKNRKAQMDKIENFDLHFLSSPSL